MSEKKLQLRGENGRFVKGQSGNPTGRPATPVEVKKMLKCATVPAVTLLINTMMSDAVKPELRVKCAEILIDRVMGKAVQPLEAIFTTPAVDLSDFTADELRRLAAYDEKPNDSEGGEE